MPRRFAYLIPLLFGLVLAMLLLAGLYAEEERHAQESRLDVFYKLSAIQGGLETGLNSRLYLADAIKSSVMLHPDLDQTTFAELAKGFIGSVGGIRFIELAKDNAISHIYPEKTADLILGRKLEGDFPSDIRQLTLKAMSSRQTQVTPPVSVIEGGEAIISATPVYLPGSSTYWGMV
ncbi:histidine kinase, partial [Pseudodesulfovibrio sp.]|nr:histidine kinase [Pseudodesulfovibrio sp.]